MSSRAIELTEIKRDLAKLPESKLAEVHDYIRQRIPNSNGDERNIKSLEGIWEGLGWEKIEDLEGELRQIRKENAAQILKRFE